MKRHLIVDGYNLIYHWAKLKRISDHSLEEARELLIHDLENFSGFMGYATTLVFDAYARENKEETITKIGKMTIVYTAKDQTADAYIERFIYELPRLSSAKVVTSDYAMQQIVLGKGFERIPSRELIMAIKKAKEEMTIQNKQEQKTMQTNWLSDHMDDGVRQALEKYRRSDGK